MTAPLASTSLAPTTAGRLEQGRTPTQVGLGLEGGVRVAEGRADAVDFEALVRGAVGEVSSLEGRAVAATDGYVAGEHQDLHGTMVVMQEADIALRLATNVRNRVIEAYREVMRMGA